MACAAVLPMPSRGPVCGACWDAVPWYGGPLCAICGAEWVGPTVPARPAVEPAVPAQPPCPCEGLPAHVDAIACAARFEGPMRAIVHAFKYGGHQSIAAPLAAHLAAHPHLRLQEIDLVVPVPLHPWRRVRRGFNQAERLARGLGPPVVHALARLRWRPPQAGLAAAQRRLNVGGAVSLRPALVLRRRDSIRASLAGARVLLVDDVVTTGGTLAACAEALRRAGVREVRAATAARAGRTPNDGIDV